MHRYKVEFATNTLDETKLRDVLERKFRLSCILIIRDTSAKSAAGTVALQAGTPLESAILELLSNRRPWRRKVLIQKTQTLASLNAIHATLMRLERSGSIKKPRHGVYISADAPEPKEDEIPPMNMKMERPSHQKAMEMLSEPRSAVELRKALGVTRQRVDQMLKGLIKEGTVRRFEVAGERGAYVYMRAEQAKREAILRRLPDLHNSRERLLSALAPETLSRTSDVAAAALLSSTKMADYVEQLSAKGLVITFKLGQHQYVGITPRGLQYPQYDRDSPKAPVADITADFGEVRIRYIEILSVLGTARTIDLTYAMPKGYFADTPQKSGQIIRRLEMAGIIEEAEAEEGRHPKYRLTDNGHFIAGILCRSRSLVPEDNLRRMIADRHREKSEQLRSIGIGANYQAQVARPTQESIIYVLRNFGRLCTKEILDKMETKFSNPHSIHLTLRTLMERGVIRRAGTGQNNTAFWELAHSG